MIEDLILLEIDLVKMVEADTAMTNLINMQRQSQRNRSRYKTVKEEIRKSKFVFDVIHRVDGKIKNKQNELSFTDLFQTIHFDLQKNKLGDDVVDDVDDDDTTIDDGVPTKAVPELLVLGGGLDTPDNEVTGDTLDDLYSAVINGNDVRRLNYNTFKGRKGEPFSVVLRAKDASKYRIKYFQVLKGSITDELTNGFEKVNAGIKFRD